MSITIREIRKEVFEKFSNNHIMRSQFQTIEYAELMSKYGYDVMFVGGFEGEDLAVASLILLKGIAPTFKYAYAPRGFLVNYYDLKQVNDFTKKLQNYLYKKNVVFCKINPELIYTIVNPSAADKKVFHSNFKIVDNLQKMGYRKLKENIYFESILPRFSPVISLYEYDIKNLKTSVRNKIEKNSKNGLNLLTASMEDIPTFYEFIKKKKNRPVEYYKDYYSIYSSHDMMDLLILELDNTIYLEEKQNEYRDELEKNNNINKEFQKNPSNKNIYNKKLESDKKVSDINLEITEISNKLQKNVIKEKIAGALVVKYFNRVYVLVSGFNKDFAKLTPNYVMFGKMIQKYKDEDFAFMDLNGITGDFSDSNPYKGLNDFKMSFKPIIYEYFGEFDLIINKTMYSLLLNSNILNKEFTRKDIKEIPKNEETKS